jgi:hypothetical protein
MQHINKERIKELKAWAKENLTGKEVYHSGLEDNIRFTVTGLKEYLNQPFVAYSEKNEAVKNIVSILQNATYKGFSSYHKSNKSILYSHIFETEAIGKTKSWLIVRESTNGTISFYGISDNKKVMSDLKRK